MEKRLIDANKLALKMDKIAEAHEYCCDQYDEGVADTWNNAAELVRETPNADAESVADAYWEATDGNEDWVHCSACGYEPIGGSSWEDYDTNTNMACECEHCPRCCAKMGWR